MKLDSLNISIVKHLKNGRKSYRKIAEKLSITENTVRARVKKMKDDGVLSITGLVTPDAVSEGTVVYVGVKLCDMELVKKGKEFSQLRGVISVSLVTGRYDLIVTVFLKENFGLLEFFTEEVSHLDGVQSVESFVVYKGYNLNIPLC